MMAILSKVKWRGRAPSELSMAMSIQEPLKMDLSTVKAELCFTVATTQEVGMKVTGFITKKKVKGSLKIVTVIVTMDFSWAIVATVKAHKHMLKTEPAT